MPPTYSVQFVGYVIQDEFTEYHMKVTSSDNTSWLVRRRYKEYRELHDHLKLKYPERMPSIPGKKLWGNQDPDFVRQRQDQLQVYMNAILALEPDCRTRVLQRFLEIKRISSGGSPAQPPVSSVSLPAAQRSNSDISSVAPQVAPVRHSPTATAISKQKQTEELNKVVDAMNREIFDLSVTPSLIDAGEYENRYQRYQRALAAGAPIAVPKTSPRSPPTGTDLASLFAQAAFIPGAKAPEVSRAALSSILGKGPIATENDLVAFFSLKPAAS